VPQLAASPSLRSSRSSCSSTSRRINPDGPALRPHGELRAAVVGATLDVAQPRERESSAFGMRLRS
jgi:hypothetical protein